MPRLTTVRKTLSESHQNAFSNHNRQTSLAWVRDVLASIAVSVFIILFLYQPVRVEGTSMVPMLQDQDRLFINKLAYRVGDVHHNDVVVFHYPRDLAKSYIKRVIAVPGDRIRIDHGRVFVNGVRLQEPYVPARYTDERSYLRQGELCLLAF